MLKLFYGAAFIKIFPSPGCLREFNPEITGLKVGDAFPGGQVGGVLSKHYGISSVHSSVYKYLCLLYIFFVYKPPPLPKSS